MDKLDSAVTEKSQSLEKRLHELATKSQEDPNTRRQLEQLIKLMESVVPKDKDQPYLEAARKTKEDPQQISKTQILYLAAVTHSESKAAILKEYIGWQGGLIEQALKNDQIQEAQDRLRDLGRVCDQHMSSATLKDMDEIQTLMDMIKGLNDQFLAWFPKRLDVIANRINEGNVSYQDLESLLSEIEKFQLGEATEPKRKQVARQLMMKLSCLTAVNQPLVVPPIGDDTPWNEWLLHFVERLNSSEISLEQKFNEIVRASDFITAARRKSDPTLSEALSNIEMASRNVHLKIWENRVAEELNKESKDLDTLASLLEESQSFSPQEQSDYQSSIIQLNRLVLQTTSNRLFNEYDRINSIRDQVSQESYLMMIVSIQTQYQQLFLRVNELEGKYPQEFTELMDSVASNIGNLEDFTKYIKSDLQKTALRSSITENIEQLNRIKEQLGGRQVEISNEQYLMEINNLQSSYMQLLSRMQGLVDQYPEFSDKINEISGVIQGLILIAQTTNDTRVAVMKESAQSYLMQAKEDIDTAEKMYEEGRSGLNDNDKLRKAWRILMNIHPEDLYFVSSPQRARYDLLKMKIEQEGAIRLEDYNDLPEPRRIQNSSY